MKKKNVYVISGPNGSGKTTFASKFLPEYIRCPNFVNADLIATGLSPFSPEIASVKAGRIVLSQIDDFARRGEDFGFETTLAGRSYLNTLRELGRCGYVIHFFSYGFRMSASRWPGSGSGWPKAGIMFLMRMSAGGSADQLVIFLTCTSHWQEAGCFSIIAGSILS